MPRPALNPVLTLKELLQTFTPDQLETLRKALHLKPDEGQPQRLLQRLDNSERTRRVFAELEPTEKHVLRYLLSQGGMALENELMERLPDAAGALQQMIGNYLVFPDLSDTAERRLYVPQEYARFISLTPAEKSTLANLLNKQPPTYQADLAAAHGWGKLSKPVQIQKLKQEWLSTDKLNSFLEKLPEEARALWSSIVSADGVIDLKTLVRAGTGKSSVLPGQLDRTQPLDALYAYGLVFPNQWPHPSCFVIPSDILEQIKGKKAVKSFSPSTQTPTQLRTWGLRILSDLQLLAAYQVSRRLEFTQNGIPLRHQLRVFLKAIGVPEETYGLFLSMSMEVFFSSVLKKEAQTLDANPAESMSRLIVHWRDGEAWQESAHWRDKRRSPEGHLDKTLKAKRLIVLKSLEELPTQQWIAYHEFENAVFEAGWKRVDTGVKAPNAYYHNERWPRRDFRPELDAKESLANMVAESLVWLGLIDVGIGKIRKSGWDLTHIRLTDWGRQYLNKRSGRFEPLPPVQAETQFRVLPNLEISVSPRLRPDLLAQLFKMSALKGLNSFSLTKESLREALDEGMTLQGILDFLRANSAHTLPPIVQQFVEEVAKKHGHIKLGIAGAYLQVDDPMIMVALRAHRSLKDIFQKRIGDQLALLTDKDLTRIAKVLRKMGYFPVIEKSEETEHLNQKFHW